ncbi:MAG TPA: hypothetical protein VHY48_11860 [Acidobacteriaceae bacterium]|jgi:hypothetical protein|nr:hypothetical protein [Acidobacteriaceae bacterium]
MGAGVGALLASIALTDVFGYHFLSLLHLSDRLDFYLCWWTILGFAPWHAPIALFYMLITFLNACTYAILFFIIGAIVRITQRLTSRQSSEVNHD